MQRPNQSSSTLTLCRRNREPNGLRIGQRHAQRGTNRAALDVTGASLQHRAHRQVCARQESQDVAEPEQLWSPCEDPEVQRRYEDRRLYRSHTRRML